MRPVDMPLMFSMQAEQSVLGCLLNSNSAQDKISDFKTDDINHAEHRKIIDEIVKQITAGKVCDFITAYDGLGDAIDDGFVYLNLLAVSTP